MFSQFTLWRTGGSLFVRAVDIRALRDLDDHSVLVFETTPGHVSDMDVVGTAEENLNRLKQEEAEALLAAEKLRQRQANGLPATPVLRGRK